jgi:hypothetical protein
MTRKQLLFTTTALTFVGVAVFFSFRDRGDSHLQAFVIAAPEYPIVFTSRSNTASLRAASMPGEGFTSPGLGQWQASEGRLRILSHRGYAKELTWQKQLPDGSTLIDVMSPSISPDGKRILFAGRCADKAGGRFRIYQVNLDGYGLQQLTGLDDDSGTARLPPMRYGVNGEVLDDTFRKQHDYDDVDPVETENGVLVFASSRMPDLGGDHNRRATQIWAKCPNLPLRSLSASRANDRWPYILHSGAVAFTLWSHLTEVVSADGKSLQFHDPKNPGLTAPPNHWSAMSVMSSGERFSLMAKAPVSLWRIRPTFTDRLIAMTPYQKSPVAFTPSNENPEDQQLTLVLVDPGRIGAAPSALARDSTFPKSLTPPVIYPPGDGAQFSLATPSAMPTDGDPRVVVSFAPMTGGRPDAKRYGIAELSLSGWSEDSARTQTLDLKPLFDDPEMIDSEPVVAYRRALLPGPIQQPIETNDKPVTTSTGDILPPPLARIHVGAVLKRDGESSETPGHITDTGAKYAVPTFDANSLDRIVFYSTARDRFNDPVQPRIRGSIRKIHEEPIKDGDVRTLLPVDEPTILMGLGRDGKLASVLGAADSTGNRGKFYALAADHYSGARPNGYHFCTSCHAGHSHTGGTIAAREVLK